MLAVGDKFIGQASSSTPTSMCTSEAIAILEFSSPVIAIISIPMFLSIGSKLTISSVFPEFDKAITTSLLEIIPRSP